MVLALETVRPAAITSFQTDLLLGAACNLLAQSLNALCFSPQHIASTEKTVNRFMELSMKSRSEDVQEAVASAVGRLSKLRNCEVEAKR